MWRKLVGAEISLVFNCLARKPLSNRLGSFYQGGHAVRRALGNSYFFSIKLDVEVRDVLFDEGAMCCSVALDLCCC
jgi:hypothetical protein